MALIGVVGARGMLGRAWMELLGDRGVAYTRPEIDVCDPATLERISGVDAVINCTAYTNVDAAESDEEAATALNGEAVENLAERCRALGVPLVHYSTDYVFDGRASAPYAVDAPTAPIGAYGRSKLAGEQHEPDLVIRTSWLYAPWSKNFVRTIAAAAKTKPELKVVNDQRGRPTSSEHLARASLALLDRGARGTFHVTDGGECTWFEFAREIAAAVAPECRVLPCTTAEFPRPAPRPAYSVLDLSKTEALLGPMPDWRENLRDVLGRLE